MTHKTRTMESVKALRKEAEKTAKAIKAVQKLKGIEELGGVPASIEITLKERRENLRSHEKDLKDSLKSRIEDISVYFVERRTKNGNVHKYWHAEWRVGQKMTTRYLGACSKVSQAEALEKAKRLKTECIEKIAASKKKKEK
jgi:hypothetical protein